MKTTRVAALVLLLLAVAGMLIVLTFGHRRTTSVVIGTTYPPSGYVPGQPSASPTTHSALIYTVAQSGGDDNELAPESVSLPATVTPAHDVLIDLIASPRSPLPAGTRLLGVSIDGGLATVNMSPEFKSNFHGGDLQEAQAVNSILMTLGQFNTIDRVQILVNGTAIDSLGGHFEISDPIDVVRPSTFRQASNSQD